METSRIPVSPSATGLDRVVERVQAVIHRRLFARVFARLSSVQRTALDQLLVIRLDERQTALQAIKRRPRRAARKNLDESIEHLEWLESLIAVEDVLKDVAPSLIRDFGRQARTLDAGTEESRSGKALYVSVVPDSFDAGARPGFGGHHVREAHGHGA